MVTQNCFQLNQTCVPLKSGSAIYPFKYEYVRFSEKPAFLACAYHGVRNLNFTENFACALNGCSHIILRISLASVSLNLAEIY